mmetsp:Transcript_17212/g.34893  ORF Transcript_17212/g.34893 Transcript_17212/m.34893 type:complete len:230 (+) Transcript_17212:750-1439(+)
MNGIVAQRLDESILSAFPCGLLKGLGCLFPDPPVFVLQGVDESCTSLPLAEAAQGDSGREPDVGGVIVHGSDQGLQGHALLVFNCLRRAGIPRLLGGLLLAGCRLTLVRLGGARSLLRLGCRRLCLPREEAGGGRAMPSEGWRRDRDGRRRRGPGRLPGHVSRDSRCRGPRFPRLEALRALRIDNGGIVRAAAAGAVEGRGPHEASDEHEREVEGCKLHHLAQGPSSPC